MLVTVLLIVETFRLLLPGLWSEFSPGMTGAERIPTRQGRLRSFLTLWFLAVVQVLSPSFASRCSWRALAYGPWWAF